MLSLRKHFVLWSFCLQTYNFTMWWVSPRYIKVKVEHYLLFMFSPWKIGWVVSGIKYICLHLLPVFYLIQPSSNKSFVLISEYKIVCNLYGFLCTLGLTLSHLLMKFLSSFKKVQNHSKSVPFLHMSKCNNQQIVRLDMQICKP